MYSVYVLLCILFGGMYVYMYSVYVVFTVYV